MKLWLTFFFVAGWYLASAQCDPGLTLTPQKSPFFTGTDLHTGMSIDPALRKKINSIAFTDGVADTSRRMAANLFRRERDMNLGNVAAPGVYYLRIDLVSDSLSAGRYDHLYGLYELFVYPFGDSVALKGGPPRLYPIPTICNDANPITATHFDAVFDSLFDRMSPDTLNASLDKLVQKSIANKEFACDDKNHQSRKMAIVLNHFRDSCYPITSLTIVLEPLDSPDNRGLPSDRLTSLCLAEFEQRILDTTSGAIDTTSLTIRQRALLSKCLTTMLARANVIFSNDFVSSLLLLEKGVDINGPVRACKNYYIVRKSGIFDQIVFLMQLPLNPSPPPG